MTLKETIQNDIAIAIKERNDAKLSALRSIKSEILVEESKGSHHELTDNEVVKIIQKLSKQREESINIYKSAGRSDLVMQEFAEKGYLDKYIPAMLTDIELYKVIDDICTELHAMSMKDMSNVMKALNARYPNRIDGKVASLYIKDKLG